MIVGFISARVVALLGLDCEANTPIMMNATNIAHMQTSHPSDYAKYGSKIREIIESPDYVGQNPTDLSIEYVRAYMTEGEYVKVAVRVSGSGRYFARSLYVLNNRRVQNFIQKGTLKKI